MTIPIDSNDSAFPHDAGCSSHRTGISIRAELAARAMEGILACGNQFYHTHTEETSKLAVAQADALIRELNKSAAT